MMKKEKMVQVEQVVRDQAMWPLQAFERNLEFI